MALKEKTEWDFELRSKWNVQVRKHNIILKDGIEKARSYERYVLTPFSSSKDSDGKWVHTPTDISGEDATIQNACNAIWTDAIKTEYKTFEENRTGV
jgi:hypothetical protein